MDIANFIFSFLSFAAVVISFFLIKSYLPKYAEEKGKNQATKEDIGEITDIVESIKSELLQKTEELKAQLSFTNQHKLSVKQAERDALFDYNKKLSTRLYHLHRYSIFGYDTENYKDIDDVFKEIHTKQLDLDISGTHLSLLFRDQEFNLLKNDLEGEIIKYEGIITNYALSVKQLLLEAYYNIKANPSQELQIRQNMAGPLGTLQAKTNDMRTEQFGNIYDLYFKLKDLIHQRLNKIEAEIQDEIADKKEVDQ